MSALKGKFNVWFAPGYFSGEIIGLVEYGDDRTLVPEQWWRGFATESFFKKYLRK